MTRTPLEITDRWAAVPRDPSLRLLLMGGPIGADRAIVRPAAAVAVTRMHPDVVARLISADPSDVGRETQAGPSAGAGVGLSLLVEEFDATSVHRDFAQRHRAVFAAIAERGAALGVSDAQLWMNPSSRRANEVMAALAIAERIADPSGPRLLIDTAPMAHTLRLLGMPETLGRWLDTLDALLQRDRSVRVATDDGDGAPPDELDLFAAAQRRHVRALTACLRDPDRCRFVPVAVAEAMSVASGSDLRLALDVAGIATPGMLLDPIASAAKATSTAMGQSRTPGQRTAGPRAASPGTGRRTRRAKTTDKDTSGTPVTARADRAAGSAAAPGGSRSARGTRAAAAEAPSDHASLGPGSPPPSFALSSPPVADPDVSLGRADAPPSSAGSPIVHDAAPPFVLPPSGPRRASTPAPRAVRIPWVAPALAAPAPGGADSSTRRRALADGPEPPTRPAWVVGFRPPPPTFAPPFLRSPSVAAAAVPPPVSTPPDLSTPVPVARHAAPVAPSPHEDVGPSTEGERFAWLPDVA